MSIKAPTPQQLLSATRPHRPLSQPVAYASSLPKKDVNFQKFVVVGGGMVFIKEIYLRRIELENLTYRRHLKELEENLNLKLLTELKKMVKSNWNIKPIKKVGNAHASPVKKTTVTHAGVQGKALENSNATSEKPNNAHPKPQQKAGNVQLDTRLNPKRKATPSENTPNAKKQRKGKGKNKAPDSPSGKIDVIDLTQTDGKSGSGGSGKARNHSVGGVQALKSKPGDDIDMENA